MRSWSVTITLNAVARAFITALRVLVDTVTCTSLRLRCLDAVLVVLRLVVHPQDFLGVVRSRIFQEVLVADFALAVASNA